MISCRHLFAGHARRISTRASPLTSAPGAILRTWCDRITQAPAVVEHDIVDPLRVHLLSLTLSQTTPPPSTAMPAIGTPLPLHWHHCLFPPLIGEDLLGADGYEMTHAPPEPFITRMWAGSGVAQDPKHLLKVGQKVTMSTICTGTRIKTHPGTGKEMVFVDLEKKIHTTDDQQLALTDTRTLVYMEKEDKRESRKIVKSSKIAQFSTTVLPTAITLFRYSALTFNSHLIHLDHEYSTRVEGHPARLVHGPLSATYMLENLRKHLGSDIVISDFKYRALSPLYVEQPITVCAKQLTSYPDSDTSDRFEVWVENVEGGLAMSGTVDVVKTHR